MGKKNFLWLQKHKKDHYFKLAKARGYRSRSAFKLLQIARRYDLLKKGKKAVDLGAAPGGWTQIASEIVGEQGYILSIDKKHMKSFNSKNVETLVMDVNDRSIVNTILEKANGKVNALISDLSPSISGVRSLDNSRQIHLAMVSFEIAKKVLDKKGNFLVKIFDSPDAQEFFKKVKMYFKKTRIIKPDASKKESSEIYIVAINYQNQKL